jgi:hypothetical protein
MGFRNSNSLDGKERIFIGRKTLGQSSHEESGGTRVRPREARKNWDIVLDFRTDFSRLIKTLNPSWATTPWGDRNYHGVVRRLEANV